MLVTHAVQEKKLEAALNKVHKFAAIERVASVYRVIEKIKRAASFIVYGKGAAL